MDAKKIKKALTPTNPWRIAGWFIIGTVAYVAGAISPHNAFTAMAEVWLRSETGIPFELDSDQDHFFESSQGEDCGDE